MRIRNIKEVFTKKAPAQIETSETFKSMNDMKVGETAYVHKLEVNSSIRRRLLDIGLVEGAKIECLQKSTFGDPSAYLIKGAVIALRSDDSKNIRIMCFFSCKSM